MPREHGVKIAPSTYYAARTRPPSQRTVGDERLKTEIARIHAANHRVYGARKVWHHLRPDGHQVARCTVERLMRELGLQGVRRGRRVRTATPDDRHERAGDLPGRDFTAPAPNRRWVADVTQVAAFASIVYKELGRAPSTISREVRRNRDPRTRRSDRHGASPSLARDSEIRLQSVL
nr:IS3 family transposase [Actinomadura rubrisoli]